MNPHRCTVAQLGARRHYAIPRLLHEQGMLEFLHTDICASKGWPRLLASVVPESLKSASFRRMADRQPRGIDPSRIRPHNVLGLMNNLRRRRARTPEQRARIDYTCRVGFARTVARSGLGNADSVYTFDGAGLEILERARRESMRGIVDQCIASRESVVRIIQEEEERFPGVGTYTICDPGGLIADRERAEWENATTIICGSEFVKETIRQAGGPVEKVVVVPSGVDVSVSSRLRRHPPEGRPLHVLFVGEVGLRKGAHYLIEAARHLSPDVAEFRLVGAIQFRMSFIERAPSNVKLFGAVPRSDIHRHYEWADVLCFPSLCEGSAIVTYEALAMGLPVITTPNSGSMVRHGIDGYIIAARSNEAILEAIETFRQRGLEDEPERPSGQPAPFSIEAYKQRIIPVVTGDKVTRERSAAVGEPAFPAVPVEE